MTVSSSGRLIFQVYAPSELAAEDTIDKMEADFEGAYGHWAAHWTGGFSLRIEREGLPAPVEKKLLELGARHKGVSVASWGYEELRQLVFGLPDTDVAALLGPIPARNDVVDVRYRELDAVLEGLAGHLATRPLEIRPVPPGKLDANGLSPWVRQLLAAGIQGAKSVADYSRTTRSPKG